MTGGMTGIDALNAAALFLIQSKTSYINYGAL